MKRPPLRQAKQLSGFALISTLAILVIVSILVVAYASTMRSERAASQNFAERERAQAVAQGMLNRILADHATPLLTSAGSMTGKRLKPYTLQNLTNLPDADTKAAYEADQPSPGIFTMPVQKGISSENGLVRVSRQENGTSESAFKPEDWAYLRQKANATDIDAAEKILAFYPQDDKGTPISPDWIEYYEIPADGTFEKSSSVPSARVSFTVWDESGKLDINMAGADLNVNGIAPHNLKLEDLSNDATNLLNSLDGDTTTEPSGGTGGTHRQRSNFSLRSVNGNSGNDRWFFSVEELLAKKLITPLNARYVTTRSRDFDVRPEWDGDRSPTRAQSFLRTYVNNPSLFTLFTSNTADVGAQLVEGSTSNGRLAGDDSLDTFLKSKFLPATPEWRQIMRLLGTLRLSLPPYGDPNPNRQPGIPTLLSTKLLTNDYWYDDDIFGIALNILQGTTPSSDQNFIAYDRKNNQYQPFGDAGNRLGIRVSPYVTETAIQVKRMSDTQIKVTEYFEIWNPYPFSLEGNKYVIGVFGGNTWPTLKNGGIGMLAGYDSKVPFPYNTTSFTGPKAGGFVIQKIENTFDVKADGTGLGATQINTDGGFWLRTKALLYNESYFSEWKYSVGNPRSYDESTSNAVSSGPLYNSGPNNSSNMYYFIPKADLPTTINAPNAWCSFQIDDPRMGNYTRISEFLSKKDDTASRQAYPYSWMMYSGQHSLYGMASDGPHGVKFTSKFGDGYNINFGDNWPGGPVPELADALSTFALPCRPYYNLGELGSIFAERPWRTLSFAKTICPSDSALFLKAKSWPKVPTTLLDYLTTVGNTTSARNLPYKTPGTVLEASKVIDVNVTARKQQLIWLFEKVKKLNDVDVPDGNLRPIRGKINLNSATEPVLTALLSAPYRIVPNLGVMMMASRFKVESINSKGITGPIAAYLPGSSQSPLPTDSDLQVTIDKHDAQKLALAIVEPDPQKAIRPLRFLADLSRLDDKAPDVMKNNLRNDYPDAVIDAIMGRLAQFGTLRQQSYTVDMCVQTLNKNVEQRRKNGQKINRAVTAEVRMLARVYFDTFSRKAFIESIEYR